MVIIGVIIALGAILFGSGIAMSKLTDKSGNSCVCEVAVGKGAEATDKTTDQTDLNSKLIPVSQAKSIK